MYDYITKEELAEVLSGLNWHYKYGNSDDSGGVDMAIIESYGGVQTFGITDYREHRNDTTEQLKKLVTKSLDHFYQRGHFYDSEGNMVTDIIVTARLGGYSARFLYPSGTTAFNRQANEVMAVA